jgi:hypothetical protein
MTLVHEQDLPVVPDRDVADSRRVVDRPLEPDLKIVVVRNDALITISLVTIINSK